MDKDETMVTSTGGVNILDFNKNPELDRLRHSRSEQNFIRLQKSLKRQKTCDSIAWDPVSKKVKKFQPNFKSSG